MEGYLELEDGSRFYGRYFGSARPENGEVVFNTGMVGYPETLTDPSYRGQILCFTYPLIGSYGIPCMEKNPEMFESKSVQVRGVIVSDYIEEYSHVSASKSMGAWLRENNIPGLCGIDTRELTKILRTKGTLLGRMVLSEEQGVSTLFDVEDPNCRDLVGEVSVKQKQELLPAYRSSATGTQAGPHVAVLDCGCKQGIVRELLKRGCTVTLVPYEENLADMDCDGFLLSNGPGDPSRYRKTIENVRALLEKTDPKPVAGICLGNQVIALAAGGRTYKLLYGHRSQNQPCIEEGKEICIITSQNHGYAIDEKYLPVGWQVWYRNLNDGTIEGIRHSTLPFFSVQFHPEASPGPTDSNGFFDLFLEALKNGQ